MIILLSDGLNTQDRWYGNGSSTNTLVDARMYDSSGKAPAPTSIGASITLYTIQVNTDGDPTSTLQKNCAGSPGKYPDSSTFFLLTSATQIVSAFQQIGTTLSNLRIAK